MYYVLDEPYPDSITNTFGTTTRGRPDGHVYDEPEADLSRRRAYVVVDNPRGMSHTDSAGKSPTYGTEFQKSYTISPPKGHLRKMTITTTTILINSFLNHGIGRARNITIQCK